MVETVLLNGRHFDWDSIKGYIEAIKNVASNNKFDQSYIHKNLVNYIIIISVTER